MFEAIDVLNAFGTPLKLAWVGWVAWGVGQYFWLRHERSMPVKKVTSVARPAVKKAAAPRTVATQAAEAPVVGRMFTPTHVVADVKPEAPVVPAEPVSPFVAQPQTESEPATLSMPLSAAAVPHPPAFDPSTAVIEQFGQTNDDVLDKFVRDFEMQDARPRRRRPRLPETPTYGAEAPSTP
jgi:hypothetical protein